MGGEMIKRVITALIAIPIVISVIISTDPIFLVLALGLTSILLTFEIISFNGEETDKWHITIIALLISLLYFCKYLFLINKISELECNRFIYLLTFFSVILPSVREIFKNSFEFSLKRIGLSVLAFVYVGIVFSHAIEIRFLSHFLSTNNPIYFFPDQLGGVYLIYVFTIAWLCDAGGYFIGKYFGQKKMGLLASPNKSWWGLFGGFAFVVIGYFVWYEAIKVIFPTVINHTIFYKNHGYGISISILLAIFSQLADLIESVYKRSADVKDSGQMIVGHGGIFDAIDSVIVPVFLFFYILIFTYTL